MDTFLKSTIYFIKSIPWLYKNFKKLWAWPPKLRVPSYLEVINIKKKKKNSHIVKNKIHVM